MAAKGKRGRTGRPPLSEGESTERVTIRLPASVLDRLDAYCERKEAQLPGLKVTRSDGLRMLVEARRILKFVLGR